MARGDTRLRDLVIAGILVFAVTSAVEQARAQGCQTTTAGLDSSKWNNAYGPIFGKAIGQTFLAEDTVIVAVTAWRPPNNRSVIGAKMFVTDTHLNGQGYLEPDRNRILLSGTVHIYDSDPPGQLIPMRFLIDPPLVLPHRGEFGIMFQAENCWQGELYPGG